MAEKDAVHARFVNHGRTARILLLVVTVGVFMPGAVKDVAVRAQALLLEMALEQPEAAVTVIVQRQADDGSAERLVTTLGGIVTENLPMINAFVAELPARAVPQLAQAPGVRWVSLDAPVVETGPPCRECLETSNLLVSYVRTIGADRLWNEAPAFLQGQNVTVAVVDSGIARRDDFKNRVVARVTFSNDSNNIADRYGHGTHIAGIIGGSGANSRGAYVGVAPAVKLVNVKVSDDQGAATTAEVIRGLQWIYDNRERYDIRVVNLSMNSTVPESYHTSPLDAALEILWFNEIVVVVSAGNNGTSGVLYPPANDPFVITVGAADDKGTADVADDVLAAYSAYGTTESGFAKPDLVAPGTDIVSVLASRGAVLAREHSDHIVRTPHGRGAYFRMSGTSMASAVVAGAAALLIQDEPDLNPDQVKHRLMATARPLRTGAGMVDIYSAVHGTTTETANTGTEASRLLWTGDDPVAWGSVSWGSVSWGSVSWGSVSWGSVSWGSDYWGN